MASILFQGETFVPREGESLLEVLERGGRPVPSSCRSGVCQSCLMRAREGAPPAESQQGLKPTLRAQGYFLACLCLPTEDLEVELPAEGVARWDSEIVSIRRLNDAVIELGVRHPQGFDYRAGQYATLIQEDGVARSYSLASVPGLDEHLLFQIALLPGGAMSAWLAEHAAPGTSLQVQGPSGNCFYACEDKTQPLLLCGTGTGLAPLYGIVRDALASGHEGPIHLFHGSLRAGGLYLHETLRVMGNRHPGFHYLGCALDGECPEGGRVGALDALLMEALPSLKGFRAYLCGAPEFVKLMQRKVFLGGVSLQEIYVDSFLPAVKAP